MTVGELITKLTGIDPSLEVLLAGGFDHSYYTTNWATECDVAFYRDDREWYEYHGDDHLTEGEEKKKAFVIG